MRTHGEAEGAGTVSQRIGVLGGTFDPLHLGHLRAAEAVRDALGLDKVLFVPAAGPPHKSTPRVTEARHRVAMVERALSGSERFTLSRLEIRRGGSSYTIDTMVELRERFSEAQLCFLTGADAFLEIQTWKDWRRLLSDFAFVVHERPGSATERIRDVLPEEARVVEMDGIRASSPDGSNLDLLEGTVFMVRRPMLHVSSSEIRDAVQRRRSVRYLVPDTVLNYIEQNHLYERG